MNAQAKIIIGGLVIVSATLAVALGATLASDHDVAASYGNNDHAGMMQSLAMMDSGAMLKRMEAMPGSDAYRQMLDQMAQHRGGQDSESSATDGMMHRMMAGMMRMMDGLMQPRPGDRNHMMPSNMMPGR